MIVDFIHHDVCEKFPPFLVQRIVRVGHDPIHFTYVGENIKKWFYSDNYLSVSCRQRVVGYTFGSKVSYANLVSHFGLSLWHGRVSVAGIVSMLSKQKCERSGMLLENGKANIFFSSNNTGDMYIIGLFSFRGGLERSSISNQE